MLLFSTVLDIVDSFTPEAFLRLVLEWNEGSIYAANRVAGIDWHGERCAKYGDKRLWLEFVEYAEKNVLAVRHEKITDDGVVWDSDFTADFSERKLVIQLDRTFSEEALVINAAFSTPHFITMLIEQGYIMADNGLPVTRTPIMVTDDDFALCEAAFSGIEAYRLPVVYVSKTAQGEDPLSIEWLASRLKGAAHVLVEQSPDSCTGIRGVLSRTEEPNGAVRVFFPAESVPNKKFTYHSGSGDRDARLEKVIRNVIHYGIAQRVDRYLTWNGVNSELLNLQLDHQISALQVAEDARKRAENEVDEVYETFDEEIRTLQEKVAELSRANEALQCENQGLRAKYSAIADVPVLYFGDEEDYYQGEIRDMILSVLDEALVTADQMTRKADVIADILENNPYHHLSEERKQRVKKLFSGYKAMTSTMKQELQSMGFELTEGGKHYKITYRSDSRYTITAPKTPSDVRSGMNCAAAINRKML